MHIILLFCVFPQPTLDLSKHVSTSTVVCVLCVCGVNLQDNVYMLNKHACIQQNYDTL